MPQLPFEEENEDEDEEERDIVDRHVRPAVQSAKTGIDGGNHEFNTARLVADDDQFT